MTKLLLRLIKKENGSVVVVVALAFTVLLGFVALATDTGLLYLERTRLVRAADAAALAGAQELPDVSEARDTARNYAQLNGVDPNTVSINFSNNNREITVIANKNVNLYFARALGFTTQNVVGRATARISPLRRIGGLVPLGINEEEILLPLTPGNQYMLKNADSGNSWRGIVAFPRSSGGTDYSNSADDYRDWTTDGYPHPVEINALVGKAPGNKSGPTIQGVNSRINGHEGCNYSNYEPDCPRIVLIPIYREEGNNLRITGFASVFLRPVEGNGNDNIVNAQYLPVFAQDGQTDDSITGSHLNMIRLSE